MNSSQTISVLYRNLTKMQLFLVLSIVIAPIFGLMIMNDNEYPPPSVSPTGVNGNYAGRTQFPWQVSIQPMNNPEALVIRCCGSLISSNRVLTAAQCKRDFSSFKLGFGNINRTTPKFKQTISRTDIVVHPRYNSKTHSNDIAIITLLEDVPFSSVLQPIRLPRRSQSGMDTFSNKMASVAGWGRAGDKSIKPPNLLQVAVLNVTSNLNCKLLYGSDFVTRRTVCGHGTEISSGYSSPCGGDSGSPLTLVDVDGRATQIGIFSFIPQNGCGRGYPAGFTYTAEYLDWISQHTGIPIIN